jgi:hypothetical protein
MGGVVEEATWNGEIVSLIPTGLIVCEFCLKNVVTLARMSGWRPPLIIIIFCYFYNPDYIS